jgi:signal transduction histidine kinase
MLTPAANEQTVVVIDDDEVMCHACQQILQKSGYAVEAFHKGHEGIARLQEIHPPLLIVDIKMPEMDGFEVIKLARGIDPDLVVVVITGYATIETAVEAMKAGAYEFLQKPFTPDELRMVVERGFERWHLTKEAQRLRREKEEVERKFVTLVSHQLKSPVAAIKQYLDVLVFTSRDQLPDKAADWVRRCQVRLGELLAIIEDWLTIARIERKVLCERDDAADLGAVIHSVVSEYQQVPGGASIAISSSIAPDLPAVRGNTVTLSMVVGNLVNNAVKYNRPGGSVLVKAYPADAMVALEVTDTGMGIPEEAKRHIFEEFYRVKNNATEKIPGTGLGLVICKRVAGELGGTIEVQSEEGKGSTFTIRLPIAEKQKELEAKSGENK